MGYSLIEIEPSRAGQVITLRLNAPPANILTQAMMVEIKGALEEVASNTSVKLLIISAKGAHFSYGASVAEHSADKVQTMLPQFHALIDQLLNSPVPTLARVTGLCLGGGFELALACGLIAAEQSAQFAVPEISLGVFPPVAAVLLAVQGPNSLATEMVLTGARYPAGVLAQSGIVSRVSSDGKLDADLELLIEKRWLAHSAVALRLANRAVQAFRRDAFTRYIKGAERLYLNELMATHDAVEGISSFLERRSPVWSNS